MENTLQTNDRIVCGLLKKGGNAGHTRCKYARKRRSSNVVPFLCALRAPMRIPLPRTHLRKFLQAFRTYNERELCSFSFSTALEAALL